MRRPWTAWPASSPKGGIFDSEASVTVSIPVARVDSRHVPSGDAHDLQTWEELEEGSGVPGGVGSAGRACTCDLDECPHRLQRAAQQRSEFERTLLQRMMEGVNLQAVTPRRERKHHDAPGKRSTARTDQPRGRYIRAWHAGALSHDIAFDATIRAAALSQQHREREGMAVKVEASDLHAKIRERKVGNLLLFVLDCSGSMRAQRQLLATQAAILSLLVDAYQRRDRVALVAFREYSAAVILRPTASIELAKEAFRSITLGGPTPLSRGLLTAYQLIQQELRKERDQIPVLILISDGCANVSMGEVRPGEEAMLVGELVRTRKIRSIVLGTAGQGWQMPDGSLFSPARDLAMAMGGEFYPMDETAAQRILALSSRAARETYSDEEI